MLKHGSLISWKFNKLICKYSFFGLMDFQLVIIQLNDSIPGYEIYFYIYVNDMEEGSKKTIQYVFQSMNYNSTNEVIYVVII